MLVPLQGLALPAEVWERDVLPRRVGAYSPAWMDQLCASGELVWVGAGALGRNSGRVALYFREDAGAARAAAAARRGAAGRAGARGGPRAARARGRASSPTCWSTSTLAPEELQEALWDLAWAGRGDQRRVRAAARAAADSGPGTARARRADAAGRPLRAAAARGAARAGAGPLVADRAAVPRRAVDPSARRRALAELLLERYGILTREQVLAEGVPGGFSALYPELTQLETLGVARRGYFVEGLGGAQFALPGAVERLRAQLRERETPVVLAAVDPAQPYGAALPWPERDRRARAPAARRRAPTSCWPAASRSCTWSAAARALQTLVAADDARLSRR